MKKLMLLTTSLMLMLTAGCLNRSGDIAASASGKNLDLSGYVMLGELESANTETYTPSGKLIVGHLNYRSRKVAIPADQKVPTTGSFRAMRTPSLLGSGEIIIEYDFTAGSAEEAHAILDALEQQKANSENLFEKPSEE